MTFWTPLVEYVLCDFDLLYVNKLWAAHMTRNKITSTVIQASVVVFRSGVPVQHIRDHKT